MVVSDPLGEESREVWLRTVSTYLPGDTNRHRDGEPDKRRVEERDLEPEKPRLGSHLCPQSGDPSSLTH